MAFEKMMQEFQERTAEAIGMGGPEKLAKRKAEGNLNARERIDYLLDKDSFHYRCELTETSYIEQMISEIKFEKNVDSEIIVQLLKSRESMMSTAIGNGISLPHPRIPLMVGRNKPLISFFFPNNPLDLKSIDGKPVHTLILLISQTIKQHLSLIAHLSFLLSKETFRFALENRLDYKEILDISKKIEETRNKAQ